MALTDKQKKTIHKNLEQKSRGICPICGQNAWSIQDEIVSTTTASIGGGMAVGGPFVPMVQVICNNCGFVAHHAIATLGIDLKN